jgi:hypothetical protein
MHCPNCGSEAPLEQKFCRSCGFDLGKVARLIAEQAPDENLDSASDPKEEPSKSFRQVWFPFFNVMFLLFLVYGLYWAFTAGVGVSASIVFIAFLLGILAYGTFTEFGRKGAGGQKSPRQASSTNAPTTQKLQPPSDLEMNASVTEQTTANLAERIER